MHGAKATMLYTHCMDTTSYRETCLSSCLTPHLGYCSQLALCFIDLPPSSRLCMIVFYYSALPKIIINGYKSLNLHYFFTCGHDEVRAWTIMVAYSTMVASSILYVSCPYLSLSLSLSLSPERHQGSPSCWQDPY